MDRRQFLRGLLATLAATAIPHNGVLQPGPGRRIFDMGPAIAKLRPVMAMGRGSPLVGSNLAIWVDGEWIGFGSIGTAAMGSMSRAAYEASDGLRKWFNGLHEIVLQIDYMKVHLGDE